jgi:MYXO-CTERM domain-containing protein
MMHTARALAGLLVGVAMLFSGMNIAFADPRGNNGDVKIHDADTPQADHRNEPHVCRFYIDGFNFDVGQSGTWAIAGQPPTAGNAGTSGSWGPADSAGNWRTGVMTLADGHYKLDVNTGMGDGKHKVFWVECPGTETPSANQGQQQNGQNQQQNNQNKQQQNAPANVTGSQSKQKGSKTGTGSKSKARGSMTGTGSASKAKATNTGTQSKSKEAGAVSPAATTPANTTPAATTPAATTPAATTPGTQAGFESAPTNMGAQNATQPGTQAGMQAGTQAGVESLPSTSTAAGDGSLGIVAAVSLAGLGAAALRRRHYS